MPHEDSVSSVAFSPDGKYLATASADGTARVWDLIGSDPTSDREIARMTHDNGVQDVAFDTDGKYLATVSAGTTRMWLWRPEDLSEEVCNRLTRNLTEEEWLQYLNNKSRKACLNLPEPG
jgi:WD40 repeat protein